MKLNKFFLSLMMAGSVLGVTTSCEDMLDKGNEYVVYPSDISSPADTATYVLGILNKVQAIAVRNNLLGEVRADLVKVNSNAHVDLKNLSEFTADVTGEDDKNMYNLPRDYYAVINNCNYYLAHVNEKAGNANRNEYYFANEIAQVHSIRAWVYLQLVLAYGKVPLVTEPIITQNQSEMEYPLCGIQEICDYFIDDLKPYYGHEYPDYGNIADKITIDPQMMFFPTQLVTADLYLYKAACMGKGSGEEAAKQAAKSYYDYIVWDLNGKSNLFTLTDRSYWSTSALTNNQFHMGSSSTSTYSSAWGSKYCSDITKIPMDSAAAEGYYNELRNLYNTTIVTDLKEASISPSDQLKELSQAQTYVDYDMYKDTIEVTKDKFSDDDLKHGYYGDLRYSHNFFTTATKYNSKEYDVQSISKHNSQHISIYRASQVYLRLAEALNYAGYPRFARQILTMGLSNIVIESEVLPFYTSDEDQAFIKYFDFNSNAFVAYAERYTTVPDEFGVTAAYVPVIRSSASEVNMLGIHSRGSGLAFLNKNYIPFATVDSTAVPYAEASLVGKMPDKADYNYPSEKDKPTIVTVKKPSTWDEYGNVVVDEDTYKELNSWYTKNRYNNYVKNDSVAKYNTYLTVTVPEYEAALEAYNAKIAEVDEVYNADVAAYEARQNTFFDAYRVWYNAAYSNKSFIDNEQLTVDQAILDEQALELCYEGNRYYDLMRRALWFNDADKYMVQPISKRTSSASKLADKKNWFLHWTGQNSQIGY